MISPGLSLGSDSGSDYYSDPDAGSGSGPGSDSGPNSDSDSDPAADGDSLRASLVSPCRLMDVSWVPAERLLGAFGCLLE